MDTARFRVAAELAFKTRRGESDLDRVINKMRGLEKLTGTSSTWVGRLTQNLVGIGAGYIGINALVSGFKSLVSGAIQYQTELEGMTISTAAVIGAVENIPFEEAENKASGVFTELNQDAIKSVATTNQLVGIFNEIVGPLEGAGQLLEQIRGTTNQLVTAATALHVPLDQASSDMSRIMSGAAGTRLPLFRMLHATGAIAENAKEWNHLTAPQRVSRMNSALEKFAAASERYGHSFAGVTSTFTDIVDHIKAAVMGPAFHVLTRELGRINDMIGANYGKITAVATQIGKKLAVGVEWAFGEIEDGMRWIGTHWDEIVDRTSDAIAEIRRLLPELRAAARAYAAFSVGRTVVSTAAGAGANVARGLAAMGVGGGAAAAGGGEAAAGGAAAATLASLGPALAAFAAAAAIAGGVVLLVHDHFDELARIVSALLPDFGGESGFLGTLKQVGMAAWSLIRPLLKILAVITSGFWGPFALALGAAAIAAAQLLKALGDVAPQIEQFGHDVEWGIDDIFSRILDYIGGIVDRVRVMLDPAGFARDLTARTTGMARDAIIQGAVEHAEAPFVDWMKHHGGVNAPEDGRTPPTVNDFRGSRITVHQEFRDADPDRVAVDLIDGLMAQAERRIASGRVAPLTR